MFKVLNCFTRFRVVVWYAICYLYLFLELCDKKKAMTWISDVVYTLQLFFSNLENWKDYSRNFLGIIFHNNLALFRMVYLSKSCVWEKTSFYKLCKLKVHSKDEIKWSKYSIFLQQTDFCTFHIFYITMTMSLLLAAVNYDLDYLFEKNLNKSHEVIDV